MSFVAVPISDAGNQHRVRRLRRAGIPGRGVYVGVGSEVSAKPVVIRVTDAEHGKWQCRLFLEQHFQRQGA